MQIAECTGMDKAFKAELIHAICLKDIQDRLPGIDLEQAKSLAKIKADSLIYRKITHVEFDSIIDELKVGLND